MAKMQTLQKSTQLYSQFVPYRKTSIICQALRNRYSITPYIVPMVAVDTDFDYAIMTHDKVTKSTLASLEAFIDGIVYTH